MQYINYLPLPKIPDNLKEDFYQLKSRPFEVNTIFDSVNYFKVKNVTPEIIHWCQSIFDFEIICKYQFVYNGLPIHTDLNGKGRKVAFNYLLDTGGTNAKIMVYDYNGKVVESLCADVEKWHFLRTNVPHNVTNIDQNSVRIALSVAAIDHHDPKVEKFIEKMIGGV